MLIDVITLTGVSDSTPYCELKRISAAFPFVEWGVLLNWEHATKKSHEPKPRKYISEYTLGALLANMSNDSANTQFALHLCGDEAINEFIESPRSRTSQVASQFGTVQLNLEADKVDIIALNRAMKEWPQIRFITQHNRANTDLWHQITHPLHRVLFDDSLGTGKVPTEWPRPLPDKLCGYAGGLGPKNIVGQIAILMPVVHENTVWLDMESSLRDDSDQFDLGKGCIVLETVKNRDWVRPNHNGLRL